MQPNAELKISELIRNEVSGDKKGVSKYQFNVLTSTGIAYNQQNEGFKCLSSNPVNNELICSGYTGIDNIDQAVLIWKLDEKNLGNAGQGDFKRGLKRQKVESSPIEHYSQVHCGGGITSLKWMNNDTILAGSSDHSIKVINAETSQVQEILFTNHKVATSLDSAQGNLVLSGHEDSVVRLWDIRAGGSGDK